MLVHSLHNSAATFKQKYVYCFTHPLFTWYIKKIHSKTFRSDSEHFVWWAKRHWIWPDNHWMCPIWGQQDSLWANIWYPSNGLAPWCARAPTKPKKSKFQNNPQQCSKGNSASYLLRLQRCTGNHQKSVNTFNTHQRITHIIVNKNFKIQNYKTTSVG